MFRGKCGLDATSIRATTILPGAGGGCHAVRQTRRMHRTPQPSGHRLVGHWIHDYFGSAGSESPANYESHPSRGWRRINCTLRAHVGRDVADVRRSVVAGTSGFRADVCGSVPTAATKVVVCPCGGRLRGVRVCGGHVGGIDRADGPDSRRRPRHCPARGCDRRLPAAFQ